MKTAKPIKIVTFAEIYKRLSTFQKIFNPFCGEMWSSGGSCIGTVELQHA